MASIRETREINQKFLDNIFKTHKNPVKAANFLTEGVKSKVFKPEEVRPHFLKIVDQLKKEKITEKQINSQKKALTNMLEQGVKQKIIKNREKSLHIREWHIALQPYFYWEGWQKGISSILKKEQNKTAVKIARAASSYSGKKRLIKEGETIDPITRKWKKLIKK